MLGNASSPQASLLLSPRNDKVVAVGPQIFHAARTSSPTVVRQVAAEVLRPGQSGVHAAVGSALQRPVTPCGECPLSENLIFEIVHFPSPRPPHSTELRELSVVNRSSPPKTCAPRISSFGIHVRF